MFFSFFFPNIFATRLDLTNLKELADGRFIVSEMMILLHDRKENIVGKGENAGYQHFLLFPQWFQTASFKGSSKVRIARERVNDECLSKDVVKF